MEDPKPAKLQITDIYRYIIYVENPQDPILALAKTSGLYPLAHVQEVWKLESKPAWLKQFPVVVDTNVRKGYRGESAWLFVKKFVPPPELRHQVAAASRRKTLWTRDVNESEQTEMTSRIPKYYVK
jgi:hypothetical protein